MISKKFSTTKKDDMIWSHLCRSQTWVGSLMSQPPASKKRHTNLEKIVILHVFVRSLIFNK